MAQVAEAVKESLVGTEVEPQLSSQTRGEFMQNAKQDEDGHSYMDEQGFIDAVREIKNPHL